MPDLDTEDLIKIPSCFGVVICEMQVNIYLFSKLPTYSKSLIGLYSRHWRKEYLLSEDIYMYLFCPRR